MKWKNGRQHNNDEQKGETKKEEAIFKLCLISLRAAKEQKLDKRRKGSNKARAAHWKNKFNLAIHYYEILLKFSLLLFIYLIIFVGVSVRT